LETHGQHPRRRGSRIGWPVSSQALTDSMVTVGAS
jgi:hypothetical protein